jgi:probable F420-dependent oxidoreductase
MRTERPFRFGVVFTGAYDARTWTDLAQRLEADGFQTLLVADHYTNPMACGPLLVAAANATTTLRVGSYVYNNDFRHPALLAKEAATIDVLSGGRLELGVGAGWYKDEYDAVGLPFDPPGVRAGRFEEGIELLTRLFAGEKVEFAGQHYQITGLEGLPVPLQRPLPLLIGGGGPRMIRCAARSAHIIGFVPRSLPTGGIDASDFAATALDTKVAHLDAAVAAVGRTDGGPERSLILFNLYASLDDVRDGDWISRDLVATSPYALVGEVSAAVELLQERRERWGLTYYVCIDSDLERFAPIVHKLAG